MDVNCEHKIVDLAGSITLVGGDLIDNQYYICRECGEINPPLPVDDSEPEPVEF